MSEVTLIEITPEDEITMVDGHWLTQKGHGSTSTRDRKIKKNQFPKPVVDDGGKKKWTLAQIKRYLQGEMEQPKPAVIKVQAQNASHP